jgi:hypothetical protein
VPLDDESAIQRSIETIRQMSDEKARMGLVICKTKRDLTVGRIQVLETKLANRSPGYRGETADRQTLHHETESQVMQNQLIAAYESRLQQAQPASEQSREAGSDPEPEKGTNSPNETPPNPVMRGEWIDKLYEQGRVAVGMLQAHQAREKVRQKCLRFFTEVLDRLPEDQQRKFYNKPLRVELLPLIGQVESLSPWTAEKYRKKFLKTRKNSRKQ